MRLIKKELDKIKIRQCPKCELAEKDAKSVVFLMHAQLVPYMGDKILAATFYMAKTKQPFCTVFCAEDGYVTKMYSPPGWTSKKAENVYLCEKNNYYGTAITNAHVTRVIDEKTERAALNFFKVPSCYKTALEALKSYQRVIISSKVSGVARAKLETAEDIIARLPPLPVDVEKQVLAVPLRHSRYMFYYSEQVRNPLTGAREAQYYGYCTHCKKEHPLYYMPRHKSTDFCPGCGSEVTVMARGISRKYLCDNCNYMVWGTVGTAVYAQLFNVYRSYSVAPEDVITKFQPLVIYYFNNGEARKLVPRYNWRDGKNGWEAAQRVTENYYDYYIYPHPKDIFMGTCAEHSHLNDYLELCHETSKFSKPMCYLALYVRYPGIEHLLTGGLDTQVFEKINGTKDINRAVNFKKLRPRDMLGVSQPELKKIAEHRLTSAEILAYKALKPCGATLEDDMPLIEFLANDAVMKAFTNRGLKKSVAFIKYQQRHYKNSPSYSYVNGQWEDYLRTAEKLGYDIKSEDNLFPTNLQKSHDKTAKLYRDKLKLEDKARCEAQKRDWLAQYKALEGLTWSDGELLIRPVASREELIKEGEKLDHCVAGYADRVRTGATHILLVRRASEPEKPYYTLNINPSGKFIQCHGYKNDSKLPNSERPQSIKDFEQKWFAEQVPKWLKAKKRKEQKEQKKLKEQKAKAAGSARTQTGQGLDNPHKLQPRMEQKEQKAKAAGSARTQTGQGLNNLQKVQPHMEDIA